MIRDTGNPQPRKREPAADVDPAMFREALGHFASGLTIIATLHEGHPVGFTCQSFYSVSVDPPMVSFSVMRTSQTYPAIRETGRFSVNVLSHDQQSVAVQLATKQTDKWAGLAWTSGPAGNPTVSGALSWLECDLEAEHEAGDHLIVIGRVAAIGSSPRPEASPLLYYRGAFHAINH